MPRGSKSFPEHTIKYSAAEPGTLLSLAPQRALLAIVVSRGDLGTQETPHPASFVGHPLPKGEGCGRRQAEGCGRGRERAAVEAGRGPWPREDRGRGWERAVGKVLISSPLPWGEGGPRPALSPAGPGRVRGSRRTSPSITRRNLRCGSCQTFTAPASEPGELSSRIRFSIHPTFGGGCSPFQGRRRRALGKDFFQAAGSS